MRITTEVVELLSGQDKTELRKALADGANDWDRTSGLVVTSDPLYRLSYVGVELFVRVKNIPSIVKYRGILID